MSAPASRAGIGAVFVLVLGVTSALAQQTATEPAPATFSVTPRMYVQFDVRGFPGWNVTPGEGRVSRPSVEVRRARLGVDGNVKRVGFELSVDPQDVDGNLVKDAYAQIRLSRALRIRAGQFKLPGTRDYDPSARNLDFLERHALTLVLGVGRDMGARADGQVGRFQYEAGVFAGDGVRRDDRSGLTGAGRVVWDLPHDFEIGGSVSLARTAADDLEVPNGPAFYSASGFRFADGVYVQGRRTRVGTDVQWSPGRWLFIAEYLRMHDERLEQGLDHEDLPAAIGTGLGLSGVYRVRTRRDPSGNRILNALLRRPVDVALRYDYLGLDDAGASGLDSVRPRATNIRARSSHAVVAGSTWSINQWLRLMGNLTAEQFSDARSAPEAGNSGTYISLAARFQVEWP